MYRFYFGVFLASLLIGCGSNDKQPTRVSSVQSTAKFETDFAAYMSSISDGFVKVTAACHMAKEKGQSTSCIVDLKTPHGSTVIDATNVRKDGTDFVWDAKLVPSQ